ncbi:MAG: CsgG/HfaB family protein [Bacteroidota bacterium]
MYKSHYIVLLCLFLTSCGTYFNQPFEQDQARTGELTPRSRILENFPLPQEPVVVGVYNFKDQTGQYKSVENGSTFSTAVSQGATTMLVKALEDSKWFTPIERENLNNLLNERNIIRSTRDEFRKTTNPNEPRLPPLLFAGILLEGGIISYDSNIVTGGIGARYFGVGGSTQYRQDRLTIYLRAVSTSNGKVLKTVYVSKTILSQAIDASLFRYVNFQRLLEVETGITKNEPVQLAMKDAIERAVEALIIEGIEANLWTTLDGEDTNRRLVSAYQKEKAQEEATLLYGREQTPREQKSSITFRGFANVLNGDYAKKPLAYGTSLGYAHKITDHLNVSSNVSYQLFESGLNYEKDLLGADINLEFLVLPYDQLTPYIYGGVGGLLDTAGTDELFPKLDPQIKVQGGVGLLFKISERISFNGFLETNQLFSDELDAVVSGKRDDYYFNFGFGLNYFLGKSRTKTPPRIEGADKQ